MKDKGRQEQARCEFCGAVGVTKEHIIAESWAGMLAEGWSGPGRKITFQHVLVDPADGSTKRKSADRPAFKARRFCKTCNSGWMREMDEEAKPVIRPLILGQAAVLRPEAAHLIARWATKTMLVAAATEPTERRAELGVDRYLIPFGTGREPLDDMQLWAAQIQSDDPMWCQCYSVRLNDHEAGGDGFGVLLVVRRLALLLIATGHPAIKLRLHYDAFRAFTPILPAPLADRPWPPPVVLPNADLTRVMRDIALTASLDQNDPRHT